MKRLCFAYVLFIVNFIFSSLLIAADQKPTAEPLPSLPEIHLLVDISGSMKKTDPQNLRVKAINMFIYLIKQKALMQIQTFATTPQLMMSLKPANQAFQNEYLQKKNQITSNGQWTDIDKAINQANQGWKLGQKNIILLTDGAVDLGVEFRTKQSRSKLTESTLLALQQKGVRVFTVGFSKEADKSLLDNLAAKTNGLSQVISSANELDNVLYSMFTAIISVNGTPIDTNKDSSRSIQIDKSIHELTLILKKTEGIANLFLTDPKGLKRNVVTLSQKNNSTPNYVFISVENPIPGKWLLTGPKQEIERAIILTNVNLVSNFTSGAYFQGEIISLKAHFTQQGKMLTSPIIIENTQVSALLEGSIKNYNYKIPYTDNGVFKKTLTIDYPVSFYRLILKAQSQFLSRELQFVIDVGESPVKTTIENATYNLKLTRTDLIKEDTVTVNLTIENAALVLDGIKTSEGWQVDLSPLCSNPSSIDEARINFKGKTVSDRKVKLKLKLPANVCSDQSQFISELSAIKWIDPSLIIPIYSKFFKVEKKSTIYISILFYLIIILLLIVNSLIIGALYIYKKQEKKIILIKKQLQTESNHE